MNDAVSEAVVAELLAIVGRHPHGVAAHAVHSASDVSEGVAGTVLALKHMRDRGLIQFDKGRYYAAGVDIAQAQIVAPPMPAPKPVPVGKQSAPSAEENTMARRKKAAAEPTRKYTRKGELRDRILVALTRPMTHDQIVEATGIESKKVTNHLWLMKNAGLVQSRLTGNASSPKLWSRVGAAPARQAALVNAVNAPPQGKDPIADVLQKAWDQAQSNLDAYVVSACDQQILSHLKQARDASQRALAEHMAGKAA